MATGSRRAGPTQGEETARATPTAAPPYSNAGRNRATRIGSRAATALTADPGMLSSR